MINEDENYGTANEIYFSDEETEGGLELEMEEDVRNRFVGLIEDRFVGAEQARDFDENRWLTAYHNFRGKYGNNVRFRESEKSKVFIKVTKTKVLAAFGQLVDVIFGTGQFPIGVRETEIPEGVAKYTHLDTATPGIETSLPEYKEPETPEEEEKNPFDVGYEGDGKVLDAGSTFVTEDVVEDAVRVVNVRML